MPGNAPPVDTEREALVAYLRQQREGLKNAAHGLSEEQLRGSPTASALSVGGLIKHAAVTERGWAEIMAGNVGYANEQAYGDSFGLAEHETAASLIAELDRVAEATEAAVAAIDDLDQRVQLPSAPWYPTSPRGFSVRWVLLHVIEELARHAGHADILREEIDGATMYALMAAVEGWPETEWLKPWRPADPGAGSGSP